MGPGRSRPRSDAVGSADRPGPTDGLALLVVDLIRAYTTPGSPLFAPGVVAAVKRLPTLLRAARRAAIPVLHTRVLYEPRGFADGGLWIRKAPVLRILVPGSPLAAFCGPARPGRAEIVITKNYSSAFAGTSLASTLRAGGVRRLLLAGCTTSGCVRASAVDALQHGFMPLVVADCVGDRHPDPHRASLDDLARDWADVISLGQAGRLLGAGAGFD